MSGEVKKLQANDASFYKNQNVNKINPAENFINNPFDKVFVCSVHWINCKSSFFNPSFFLKMSIKWLIYPEIVALEIGATHIKAQK